MEDRRGGGRARRLAAGSAPAWSPDGRSVAYIGPGRFVYTVRAGGGRARRAGAVRGRTVDWQPLPRQAVPCSTGNGAIVAQSSDSVVRQAVGGGEGSSGSIGWNGCLRLLGVHDHLNGGPHFGGCYAFLGLSGIALAGRFAAMDFSYCNHDTGCTNQVYAYDLSRGPTAPLYNSGSLDCSGGVDSLRVNSSGFAAWRETTTPSQTYTPLRSISCPSASLCVAGDQAGNVLTSTDPGGAAGAWIADALGHGGIVSVTCPTTSFCLATTSGGVLTTTDPLGGPGAWTFAPVDPGHFLGAASCASASLCAIYDYEGNIVTSTDPAGGSATWTVTPVDPAGASPLSSLSAVSCPTESLCVATDTGGNVFVSDNPGSASPAWSASKLDSEPLYALSCPQASFCAATDRNGDVLTSTDPAAGGSAWTTTKIDPYGLVAISCPSADLCVATDTGRVLTSVDPTGGPSAWSATPVDHNPSAISCAPGSFCAMTAAAGYVLYSSDPVAGGSSYTSNRVDVPPCALAGTPCESVSLYVHDDQGTRIVDSAPAGTGALIANVELSGNSLELTWTHGGQPRSLSLR